jgi:Zn-dependent peptidase ImmA (M78 family)
MATVRVEVTPSVLTWAVERSGTAAADLEAKFPKLAQWEAGEAQPTFRQLESLAKATHTAVGLLLLDRPPVDELPIPDLRTMADADVATPSPNLLETVESAEQRQEWYRSYLVETGQEPLPFVASVTRGDDPRIVAADMRAQLGFDIYERGSSWSDALTRLIDKAENAGVLVMVNGVVGNNVYRRLDPTEFRGFALADPYAPVVFINGSDTKAAQIFTLAHELAHIWLGASGVSNPWEPDEERQATERWCNAVAAEFLVPEELVRAAFDPTEPLPHLLDRLARAYKVSTLVVLRRLHETGFLAAAEYRRAYRDELARVLQLLAEREGDSGGSFYTTLPRRVSKPFARALISSTLAGRDTYSEAFRLLGFRKTSALHELAARLGVG